MGRKDREKKSEKTKQVLMSVFISLIMILSVFGVLIGTQTNELKFGKYKFEKTDSGYTTRINGSEVYFYTLPYEVQYLNISEPVLARLKSAQYIITTFNPNTANESTQAIELARFDFAKFLTGKYVFNGIEKEHPLYAALPVLTCANATLYAPVVVFNVSDKSGVSESGDCIYLNGRGADFLRLRDRILYDYYGVYQDAVKP